MSRSYEKITETDLHRLSELAKFDRDDLFSRRPDTGLLYSGRLFAVALCQGAAMHYLDGKNGIKDLDIWSFYEEDPRRPFPYRRRAEVDFGLAKFGQTEGYEHFVGRKVDLIGRSFSQCRPTRPCGHVAALSSRRQDGIGSPVGGKGDDSYRSRKMVWPNRLACWAC